MAKKRFNAKSILTYVVSALLIIAIIGTVAYFFKDSLFNLFGKTKPFVVYYQDKDIETYKETMPLVSKQVLRFDCEFNSSDGTETYKEYSVKIVPYVTEETNFTFSVDGVDYSFINEESFENCFVIKTYEDYFTITIDKTMEEILCTVYPGKDVILPNLSFSQIYFALSINACNGTINMEIPFLIRWSIHDIALDKELIVL